MAEFGRRPNLTDKASTEKLDWQGFVSYLLWETN